VACTGFRLQGAGRTCVGLRAGHEVRQVVLRVEGHRLRVELDHGPPITNEGYWWDTGGVVACNGRNTRAAVRRGNGGEIEVTLANDPTTYRFQPLDPYAPPDAAAATADRIAAPIPGTVLRVDVTTGDVVARGSVLLVMEAMKTEIRIAAPADGTVARVLVKPGDMVQEGMELVQLTHDDAQTST
jgi:3-methylcrotonyl-CoA carboxylase alpha subunit